MSPRSKDYIFQENKNGELEFVGNFEGFYQAEDDPWQQSAEKSDISSYYAFSRSNISKGLKGTHYERALEIGCGVGHSTEQLSKLSAINFSGADISVTAIEKAQSIYPDISFHQLDICEKISSKKIQALGKFDCIILNQVLWYIMHAMPQVKSNLAKLLTTQGKVIFSTAFLNEQRYGREFFVGFDGFIDYLERCWCDDYRIEQSQYDASNIYDYHDGLVYLTLNSTHK